MSELLGVLLELICSRLGGTAAAVTRDPVGNADPITLAILRWGIGFLCLLPVALVLRVRWPPRSDWLAVAALGLCFFGLFFGLYNIAVSFTTAARAAPRAVDAAAADHGGRRPARHRALDETESLASALRCSASLPRWCLGCRPLHRAHGAGELIMVGAALCMSFYNVWSRPFIQRSSALGFLTVGMGAGAVGLVLMGVWTGRMEVLSSFGAPQWIAGNLSRRRRRRTCVHLMGAGAGAGDADPRRQHHDRQPDRRGIARDAAGRRADHGQSGYRVGRGVCGDMDCDDGGREGVNMSAAHIEIRR